jgi:hypothetical protein
MDYEHSSFEARIEIPTKGVRMVQTLGNLAPSLIKRTKLGRNEK